MNPIQKPVEDLFRRLTTLHNLLHILALHVEDERKRFDAGRLRVEGWTTLPFLDMSVSQPALYVYAKEKYEFSEQEYIEALEEVLCRNSAMSVSQGYEAFETFLIDTLAYYLHSNQCPEAFSKFDKKLPGLKDMEYADCRAFVKRKQDDVRNNSHLFAPLRHFAPGLSKVESGNNLCDWYAAVSEVRHAVTHHDFSIEPNRLANLTDAERRELSNGFSVCPEVADKGYRLKVTRDKAELALKKFESYGHSIFKLFSIAEHYDWDLFDKVA